jgi:hypothetical protein
MKYNVLILLWLVENNHLFVILIFSFIDIYVFRLNNNAAVRTTQHLIMVASEQ